MDYCIDKKKDPFQSVVYVVSRDEYYPAGKDISCRSSWQGLREHEYLISIKDIHDAVVFTTSSCTGRLNFKPWEDVDTRCICHFSVATRRIIHKAYEKLQKEGPENLVILPWDLADAAFKRAKKFSLFEAKSGYGGLSTRIHPEPRAADLSLLNAAEIVQRTKKRAELNALWCRGKHCDPQQSALRASAAIPSHWEKQQSSVKPEDPVLTYRRLLGDIRLD